MDLNGVENNLVDALKLVNSKMNVAKNLLNNPLIPKEMKGQFESILKNVSKAASSRNDTDIKNVNIDLSSLREMAKKHGQ